MMNKIAAMDLFEHNSFLVDDRDVISIETAEKITSKEAVEFAKRMRAEGFNAYGIGDYIIGYMNQRAFFIAVTYQNILEIKWENVKNETD